MKFFLIVFLFLMNASLSANTSANQTDALSPVLPETPLPFTLELELAPFSLPTGIQSYASAIYDGKWILISGRTNGVHGFSNIGNNFPPNFQNTTIYVVDPKTGSSISRSLLDGSRLSQSVIDALSVTASESFQKKNKLYLVGGYGINSETGQMETKSTLSEIDLQKVIKWVEGKRKTLKHAIRQVSDPLLQVTGGFLFQNDEHSPFLLMLGQNFKGLYTDSSNGNYTQQIRSFWLTDDGQKLNIISNTSSKTYPDYRRRDLNIIPVLLSNDFAYIAFAGVFTLDTGIWTVPITIYPDGSSFEPDPNDPKTFKQAMNHYNCPAFGLYSTKTENMYAIFPGGISYGYFSSGTFTTDSEIPFINQVTTINIDKKGNTNQYLMNGEYPVIFSTGTNPGNQLLFGAEAQFFIKDGIETYSNGVIQLDKIKKPTIVGYIVGGIMSTLANTNTMADSTSSPYVFTVKIIPK